MDINLKIRQYFNLLYQSAGKDAQSQAKLFIENLHLTALGIEQQVMKIHQELHLLNQKIEDFEYKEYIHFAAYEVVIYKIYSARLLFHKTKEDEAVRKAFILSARLNCLIQLNEQTQAQLPPFTFAHFLKGFHHFVLYGIDQKPLGTSQEDYFKIRCWQTRRKVECVSLEAKKFCERFKSTVTKDMDLTVQINLEIQQLATIFKNAAQLTTAQFIAALSTLRALTGVAMPENEIEFHENFCKFTQGEPMRPSLSPAYFKSSLKAIESDTLSNAPLSCWAFIKYDRWLNDLIEENGGLKEFATIHYDFLFDHIFEEGILRSEQIRADFIKKYPTDGCSVDQYTTDILNELNQIRWEYNQLEYPDYFYYFEDIEILKNYFLNNCFLNTVNEKHTEELKQVIYLHEMFSFLMDELRRADAKAIEPLIDSFFINAQMVDLITSMVPDPDLMDQLLSAIAITTSQLKQGGKPLFFIIEDLKDALNELYDQSENNLIQLWHDHPNEIKGHFLACQIRDMTHKELIAKRKHITLHELFDHLKQLFLVEQQCLRSLAKTKAFDIDSLLQEPGMQEKKLFSFGYKKSPGLLYPIIQALVLNINLLDNRTSVEEFIRIVTAQDLNLIQDKIYLGCKTNEFKYLLKHFKDYFKSFNPATIGQSGKFISINGIPMTADNLYNADISNLQTRGTINNIFSKK